MENFTLEGPIGYYNGLIIAALLGVFAGGQAELFVKRRAERSGA